MEQPRTPSPFLGKLGWIECEGIASTNLVVEPAQMQGRRNAVVGARVRGCAMFCPEQLHAPRPERRPSRPQNPPERTQESSKGRSFEVNFRVEHRVGTRDDDGFTVGE
ncbi:MAG: hypothetical protein ACPG4T_15930 [Nannocystaceae bacterium]